MEMLSTAPGTEKVLITIILVRAGPVSWRKCFLPLLNCVLIKGKDY